MHGAYGKTATFRLDGADDGTIQIPEPASTPTWNRTYQFGLRTGGKLAELRIYNKDLTTEEIQAVEAEFKATYVTPKSG